MTEDEAKEKWCPMVRTADSGEPGALAVNRDAAVPANYNCIASDCMMWAWSGEVIQGKGRDGILNDYIKYSDNYGYCGLASHD